MIRVRFAPAPTGYLHLGNVRTALFNYLFAKKEKGAFILRIEDTDLDRSEEVYEKAILEDLKWMKLFWDEGPEREGPYGPYQQSKRLSIYAGFLEKLLREGKAYYCYCTEAELDERRRLAQLEKRPPRYDNRCRTVSQAEVKKRTAQGIRPTVRFKIEKPEVMFHDLIRGVVHFDLDQMMGDFIIARADGKPTFHLGVSVDDCLMKITHVIRGEDHLSNGPRHQLLIRALGFEPPQYAHLSLIHGPGGEPLSKRLESISIREFRRRGYLPEALSNYLALLGWSPGDNREIFSWKELQELFELKRVVKSAAICDPKKLDWMNGEHLRALSDEEFVERALNYLKGTAPHPSLFPPGGERVGVRGYDESLARKILPVFKDNIHCLEELGDRLQILAEDFSYENQALIQSRESREIFQAALAVLKEKDVPPFDEFIEALKPKVKAKGKELFMPLRMALTGREHGPELKRLFPILGREGVRKRFERALKG